MLKDQLLSIHNWPGQNSYFDIKFLNPNSESYLSSSTEKVYERAETQKPEAEVVQ